MTKTLSMVLGLGLSLAACGTPEGSTPPPPASVAPVAKPAPVKEVAPTPAPETVAKPAPDPMVAANALFAAEKYAEAAQAYDAITRAQPKNALAWFNLGYSLHVTGQLDQAIVAHGRAAEFPQFRAGALYNLGCAQALQGNTDAAFDALNKALDSGFNQLKVLQEDADLESLRKDARYTALVERLTKPKA